MKSRIELGITTVGVLVALLAVLLIPSVRTSSAFCLIENGIKAADVSGAEDYINERGYIQDGTQINEKDLCERLNDSFPSSVYVSYEKQVSVLLTVVSKVFAFVLVAGLTLFARHKLTQKFEKLLSGAKSRRANSEIALSSKSLMGILLGVGWAIVSLIGLVGSDYSPMYASRTFSRNGFWALFSGVMIPDSLLGIIPVPYFVLDLFETQLPLPITLYVVDLITLATVVVGFLLLIGLANRAILQKVFAGVIAFQALTGLLSLFSNLIQSPLHPGEGFRYFGLGLIIPIGSLLLMIDSLGIIKAKTGNAIGVVGQGASEPLGQFVTPVGNSPLLVSTEPLFFVQLMGAGDRLFSVQELAQMAKTRTIKGSTLVQHKDQSYPVAVSNVPGVFSSRQYVTTLLLSLFLGGLGVDRFYLGQTGLGIGKLLTLGGCGIWSLIDLIMIAMRNVSDVDGKPLA
jgi:hypothetical protein